ADVGQRTGAGVLGVARLVRLHAFITAFADDAARIDHIDVFLLDAQVDQQVQAGDGGSAGTRADQLYVLDLLVHHFQAIQDGRRGNDGRTVLVVVKDWDLHALAQLLFYVEAFGRLDVFKVDPAQSGLEGGNDIDQLVRVGF